VLPRGCSKTNLDEFFNAERVVGLEATKKATAAQDNYRQHATEM